MTVANDNSGSTSAGDAGTGDANAVAQLVSSLRLTEEEEEDLLSLDYDESCLREEGEVMETASPHRAVDGETESAPVSAPPGDQTQNVVNPNQVIILDVQMVFHRGRGSLIKELAYRVWNTGYVYGLNMKHDVTDVPAHLVVRTANRYHDVFTGLDLESGEYDYDDKIVADTLNGYRVALVKGANKKTALLKVYDRLNAAADDGVVYQPPFVVNIDGQTADEGDRQFCTANGMTMATFSFPFVYTNMQVYLDVLHRDNAHGTQAAVLYTNNVLTNDPRYNVLGRGRVVCVCHGDHSCGGTVKYFGKRHRCSLLNLSILDLLWFRRQDAEFRKLVKAARSGENGSGQRRKQKQRTRPPTRQQWHSQAQEERQTGERRPFHADQYTQDRFNAERYEQDRKQYGNGHRQRLSDRRSGWYEESEKQHEYDDYRPYAENQNDQHHGSRESGGGGNADVERHYYGRLENGEEFQPRTYDEQGGQTDIGYKRYRDGRTRDLDFECSADNSGGHHGGIAGTGRYDNGYGQDQHALVLVIRNGRKRRRANREKYLSNSVYSKQRGRGC